jgi:hypothetical protein
MHYVATKICRTSEIGLNGNLFGGPCCPGLMKPERPLPGIFAGPRPWSP